MYKSEAEVKAAFAEALSHFEALEGHIMGSMRDEAAIVCARIKSAFQNIHLNIFDNADPPAEVQPAVETKVYSDGSSATGTAPLPDQSPEQQDAAAPGADSAA